MGDELTIKDNETGNIVFIVAFILAISGYIACGFYFSEDNTSEGGKIFQLGSGAFLLIVVGIMFSQIFCEATKLRILINRRRQSVFIEAVYVFVISKTYHRRTTDLRMKTEAKLDSYDDEYYTLEFKLKKKMYKCFVDSYEIRAGKY